VTKGDEEASPDATDPMASEEAAKQFSFRLPGGLVERVNECLQHLQAAGLEVTRADVVRMLLKHALDVTHCEIGKLLGGKAGGRPAPKSRGR
jgi:hypothetical protein